MRIAFVGKGGSGKTTSAAVLARYLHALGHPVLAIDADIDILSGLWAHEMQPLHGGLRFFD